VIEVIDEEFETTTGVASCETVGIDCLVAKTNHSKAPIIRTPPKTTINIGKTELRLVRKVI
jgi:hypothetical protein